MDENIIQSYLNDIKEYELLDAETEKELALENTPEARNELVVHNLRLALSLAKTYQNRGLSLEDLIQEANIGLMTAAEKFDPAEGCRFSTYATWWIRQALSKAVAKYSRNIRIPAHIIDINNKIEKFIEEFKNKNKRVPTNKEIGEYIEKDEAEVAKIRTYFIEHVSIDATFGEDDDTIGSVIEDTNVESPIEYTLTTVNEEIAEAVLETLEEREAKVIRLRILQGKSLESVGEEIGLTYERVRQIEAKALRKLRHPYRAEMLRSIML